MADHDDEHDEHDGAEIHIGISDPPQDPTQQQQLIVMLHCPSCGHHEFQVPIMHLPTIVAALTSTITQVAGQLLDLTGAVKLANVEDHTGTVDDMRAKSVERYNNRKH